MTTSGQRPDADLPYAGLTVLDLSQRVAGPYCGSILALEGTDVLERFRPGVTAKIGRTVIGKVALQIGDAQ